MAKVTPAPCAPARGVPGAVSGCQYHGTENKGLSPLEGGTIVSRRSLVLGVIVSVAICAAVITGLVLTSTGTRRRLRKEEKERCSIEMESLDSLGRHVALDSRALGLSMTLAAESDGHAEYASDNHRQYPFLVPGDSSVQEHYLNLLLYNAELNPRESREGTYYFFDLNVAWYPTVRHEDRDEFEAYMSRSMQRNISITDANVPVESPQDDDDDDDDDEEEEESTNVTTAGVSFVALANLLVPAPARPTYNPLVFAWGLQEELMMRVMRPLAGMDGLENTRTNYPRVFLDRLLGDGLPIARTRKLPGSSAFLISVPFCGAQNCDESTSLVGFFSYAFINEDWGRLFRKHTRAVGMDGREIKAAKVSPTRKFSHTVHVASLDIDLECFFYEPRLHLSHILLWLGALGMVAVFSMLTMVQWREIDLAETKSAMHRAAREEEASRIAALDARVHSMETTERYIDHEVKNRLMVLEQIRLCETCAKSPHKALVVELMETITTKSTLLRLATQRYSPRLEDLDLAELVRLRVTRYNDVDRPTTLEIEDQLCPRGWHLQIDKTLVNIIIDNLISNAHKYGSSTNRPPHVAVSLLVEKKMTNESRLRLSGSSSSLPPTGQHIYQHQHSARFLEEEEEEPEEEDRVEVVIKVSNAAGAEHAKLLALGEAELNRIALSAGGRTHFDLGLSKVSKSRSAGDGFPMSSTAANTHGGSVRLVLREDEVVAELHIGNLERADSHHDNWGQQGAPAEDAPPLPGGCFWLCEEEKGEGGSSSSSSSAGGGSGSSRVLSYQPSLKLALVDDCKLVRRMFEHKLKVAFPTAALHLHGDTHASIEQFATTVATVDADVVFVDQNFGKVHEGLSGTDIVQRVRSLDKAAGNPPRLIYVISANDSPDDLLFYLASGADSHIPKTASSESLRSRVLSNATRLRLARFWDFHSTNPGPKTAVAEKYTAMYRRRSG